MAPRRPGLDKVKALAGYLLSLTNNPLLESESNDILRLYNDLSEYDKRPAYQKIRQLLQSSSSGTEEQRYVEVLYFISNLFIVLLFMNGLLINSSNDYYSITGLVSLVLHQLGFDK